MATRLIFLAPPATGKGTQAKKISQEIEILHLSTGDKLREEKEQGTAIGREAERFMTEGGFVPDEIVLRIVQNCLVDNATPNWILDGFPRNIDQAIALDTMLAEMEQLGYTTIYFNASNDALVERAAKRYKELGRDDDKPETFLKRLDSYREKTLPLIDFYKNKGQLVEIDADRTVEEVFNSLKAVARITTKH